MHLKKFVVAKQLLMFATIGFFLLTVDFGSPGIVSTATVEKLTTLMVQPQEQEVEGVRQIGIGLRAHIPLKIKVKNENNVRWAHDLEIEVTNSSDKPIYFLSFSLIVQGMKTQDGLEYGFWLRYGRPKLIDFATPLEKDDVPVLPGEKVVLRISKEDANGWDKFRVRMNKPEPKKVGLVFQSLNFGDGTGFADAGGTFVNIRKGSLQQRAWDVFLQMAP